MQKNNEGYRDPTATKAINKVMREEERKKNRLLNGVRRWERTRGKERDMK